MRLPAVPWSSSVRTDTGTSARISTPSVRRPRAIRKSRRAPATTASTTSLTVPPNAFLTVLKSSRLAVTATKRRCGPIGTFSGVSGAGFRPAQTISPIPSAASRTRASARSGWDSASSAPSTSASPARAAPVSPAATSCVAPGSGCGCQARPEFGICGGSGERSNSTVARSTPAMPSISEWWVFVISAKRSSSRPSISHISHSGLERSSCWEKMRAVSSCSCSNVPGAGRARVADVVLEVEARGRRPTPDGRCRSPCGRACGGSGGRGAGAGGSVRGTRPSLGGGPSTSVRPPMCMCERGPPGAGTTRRRASAGRGGAGP